MNIKHLHIKFILLTFCVSLLFSCSKDYTPSEPIEEEPQQAIFMASPPEFDIELRDANTTPVKHFITSDGVSVNISKRPWVGTSLNNETDFATTRATWDDIAWDPTYADIGLFTLKTSVAEAAIAGNNYSGLVCFPFYRSGTTNDGVYEVPPAGNGHASVGYQYYNANFKVNARDKILSTEFFNRSNGEPLNFYGYFPYQQQTRGKVFTERNTSICKLYRSDLHEINLTQMPFSFMASQNVNNLKEHDVMYSVSEDGYNSGGSKAHPRNRYGNRGKTGLGNGNNNANVHMRFVHAFCRLQFKISNGTFRYSEGTDIKISKLYVIGKKVFTDGHINLIEGKVTPINASRIERTLDNGQQTAPVGQQPYVNIRNQDLEISMIVQPTGIIGTLEDFIIVCEVDGVEYRCPLPINTELKPNNVYDINLDLSPETIVRINSGGGALVSLYEDEPPVSALTSSINESGTIYGTFSKTLVITPHTGWRLSKIFKNGVLLPSLPTPIGGDYFIDLQPVVENEVTTYDVVCLPDQWYVHDDKLRIHLDAKLNNGFTDEKHPNFKQQIVSIWKDISYNGNDAFLYNFDLLNYCVLAEDRDALVNGEIAVKRSGWDTKGLKFDGIDDYVVLPGTINREKYTMSFYICVALAQQNPYPRIISEGTGGGSSSYPSYYLRTTSPASRLGILGHNVDTDLSASGVYSGGRIAGVDIIQIDAVYDTGGAANGSLRVYFNGVRDDNNSHPSRIQPNPQEYTALGGLLYDVSRHSQITFYSFMLYDTALTQAEIQANYEINKARYGTKKTVIP